MGYTPRSFIWRRVWRYGRFMSAGCFILTTCGFGSTSYYGCCCVPLLLPFFICFILLESLPLQHLILHDWLVQDLLGVFKEIFKQVDWIFWFLSPTLWVERAVFLVKFRMNLVGPFKRSWQEVLVRWVSTFRGRQVNLPAVPLVKALLPPFVFVLRNCRLCHDRC